MDATVQKWGNSLALRIPRSVAKDVHLHAGAVVELAVLEGKMIVKSSGQHKYSLSQMLKAMTKKNCHSEHDWGRAIGQETW